MLITDEIVGGWSVEYEGGMSYVTVRGAGHEVPMFRPSQALQLISHFVNGQRLPDNPF
ncbi:hypothetical protein M569_09036 [Genlisea aurea]|uniref:Uncharacterized protein n=1 Tax=Genlisea aurea TaxID=192259 RepID=S8CLT4_9LAMI|nr:hypothetical protein M569_09036 [Genlisea aurea]